MLIDWDTVGLAPPERDLWMVATETGAELRRYTELTGRPVDLAAIELYRLRWALDDLSCFVRDLRAPHRRTPGTEHAWEPSKSSPLRPTPTPAYASSHPSPRFVTASGPTCSDQARVALRLHERGNRHWPRSPVAPDATLRCCCADARARH